MKYLDVNIKSIKEATSKEKVMLSNSCKMLEAILNSNVFQKKISQEVKETMFLSGEMDLNILMYHSGGYSKGTANPELGRIRLNRKYATNDASICQTLTHEYLHILGFEHETGLDLNSVPYKVSGIVRKLINRYGRDIKDSGFHPGQKLTIKRPWYFLWLIETINWK